MMDLMVKSYCWLYSTFKKLHNKQQQDNINDSMKQNEVKKL